jgi:glyoxylase-like metal-dependent hydrolase (beta-lactamase superfamily II)
MQSLTRRNVLSLAAAGSVVAAATHVVGAQAAHTADASKPAKLPQGAGYYQFQIGSIRCVSLGDAAFDLPTRPTWGSASANDVQDIASVLAYDLKKADAVPAYVQPLVIEANGARILVDTGNGPQPGADGKPASKLRASLAATGLTPADIDVVLLTHLHGDHVGGLWDADGSELFSKARFVVHKDEFAFWSGATPDMSKTPNLPDGWKQGIVAGAKKALAAISSRVQQVSDGDVLAAGVKVKHFPGHTPGLMGLTVSSGDQQLVIANDVMHNETLSLRRPAMQVMFDTDIEQGIATRLAFLREAAAEKQLVFSYHMPFPALGRIRAEGGAYAWVAEGWNW